MNSTGNGRWGRYKVIDDVMHKKCTGPLHPEEGAWLPLRSFFINKKGPRAGKPIPQCIECQKTSKGLDPKISGLIPISRVWWIFIEIKNRVGKAETCRLVGVSQNFWFRAERGIYVNMRRATARRAIEVLHDLRTRNVVRHRDSIRHGAALRGREEKKVINMNDVYIRFGDSAREIQNRRRRQVS